MEEHDKKSSSPTHEPGTRKGEEMAHQAGKEPGRHDTDSSHAGRPSGKSTARDATGINPQDPIDPKSPNLPPD